MIASGIFYFIVLSLSFSLVIHELIRYRRRKKSSLYLLGSNAQMVRRFVGAILVILLVSIVFIFYNFLSVYKNPFLYFFALAACLFLALALFALVYFDLKDIKEQLRLERERRKSRTGPESEAVTTLEGEE